MELKDMAMGTFIFVALVIAMGLFYSEGAGVYKPANYTSDVMFATYNDTRVEMATELESLQNHTVGFATKGIGDLTKYSDLAVAFVDIGRVLFDIPNIISRSIINTLGANFGLYIPEWLTTLVAGLFVVVVTFKVASIFLNRESI